MSFEGNVCFCKGRYHFYKYCHFIQADPQEEEYPRTFYKCKRTLLPDVENQEEFDLRFMSCISFFDKDLINFDAGGVSSETIKNTFEKYERWDLGTLLQVIIYFEWFLIMTAFCYYIQ